MSETPGRDIPIALACAELHESWHTVRLRIFRGELAGSLRDGRWYVERAALDALLTRRTASPEPAPVAMIPLT
jgi:hypothetical protein